MTSEPTLAPRHGIQTARGFTLVCLGLFLMVLAITSVTSFMVDPSSQPKAEPIATFTGKDNGTTGSFKVKQNWEFRWTHNGHLKQIIWKRSDGHQNLLMEIQRKIIRKHGSLNYDKPGEYKFEVIGEGDWKIEVYQF